VIETGGAKEAYEQLRRHMLAPSPRCAAFGLAVLLKEGVAAWIQGCVGAPLQPITFPSQPLSSIVIPPLQAGIVQILATIALSRTQEMQG
jgi:cell shape-determining protein MreD